MFLFLPTPLIYCLVFFSLQFHTSAVVLQHFLHTASACSPFINLHLHGHMIASCCVGELTLTHEPIVPPIKLHIWGGKMVSKINVLWHIPVHRECLTDLWVSRNVWGKHLYQSGNRIVPRWQCYSSVMSFVNCAKVTISRRRLSSWREFFPLLCALVHHQF